MVPDPTFVPVRSTNILGVVYYHENKTMDVKFVSGSVFRYLDVPPEVHQEFLDATSKGSYFYKHIRGKFESKAVKEVREATCPSCGDHGIRGAVCEDCGCANYSEAYQ